jgi:hypothetical protein
MRAKEIGLAVPQTQGERLFEAIDSRLSEFALRSIVE